LWLTFHQIKYLDKVAVADSLTKLFHLQHFDLSLSGPELGIKKSILWANTTGKVRNNV